MKKSKRIFILTALLFSFLSFPVSQVFATPDMAEVPLTVKQSFVVKNPAKEMDFTGTYEFCTTDEEAPMPEGTKDGIYSFSLNGEQAETTIDLQYLHAGAYRYQLEQIIAEKKGYQYDKSCYDITVYVENGKNGELIPQVMAKKGEGEKSGELEFLNSYQGEKTETSTLSDPSKPNKPIKTGDTTHIMVYVGIATGSLCLILALIIQKNIARKNNRV